MVYFNTVKIRFCFHNILLAQKKKKDIVDTITHFIPDDDQIGFAGYLNREDLSRDLHSFIFGASQSINLPNLGKDDKKEIRDIIKDSVEKCRVYANVPPLNIFIFPTQDPRVLKSMEGVNGFTPYKGTIHIYINPNARNEWQKHLISTVIHEIAHVLSREQFEWNTILDSLIFEGLAEHFREQVSGGKKMPWTVAITKKDARHIIKKLEEKKILQTTDDEFYMDLFFGGKKFKKWSGYTVGYFIIETVLRSKKYKVIDLLRRTPTMIFMMYKNAAQR